MRDGTTTATVLAQKIIREGRRVIAAGMNPMDVKRGIDMAVSSVVADKITANPSCLKSKIKSSKVKNSVSALFILAFKSDEN